MIILPLLPSSKISEGSNVIRRYAVQRDVDRTRPLTNYGRQKVPTIDIFSWTHFKIMMCLISYMARNYTGKRGGFEGNIL